MFFTISKIAWLLLAPLNLILSLFLVGFGLLFVWRKGACVVLGLALGIFLIVGLSPLGPNLLARLENQYAQPEARPAHVDGIIILGGAFETEISQARDKLAMNDGIERVTEGIRLSQLYPGAKLVFSGGEGLLLADTHPESHDVRLFLQNIGFNPDRAIFEEKSRNTYENVLFSKELLQPKAGESWIVVTSAYHMGRAVELFKAQGWDVIPWPVDYRTTGGISFWPSSYYVAGNIYKTDLALHEYAGLLVYHLTGKL